MLVSLCGSVPQQESRKQTFVDRYMPEIRTVGKFAILNDTPTVVGMGRVRREKELDIVWPYADDRKGPIAPKDGEVCALCELKGSVPYLKSSTDKERSDARNDLVLWLEKTLEKTKALAEQDSPVESLACVEAQVIATEIQIQKAMTRARRNCRCSRGGVQCHNRVEHPENHKSRWCSDCRQNRCNCECNGCM